jgi:murein L,D-transpeptidase YafK
LNLSGQTFKKDQLKHLKVETAYAEKGKLVEQKLLSANIKISELEVFLRYYKTEKELQLWGKDKSSERFTLLVTYKACRSSGNPGPKRRFGDRQTPEGFYTIKSFNPFSSYYLSLEVNYPNYSDRIWGEKGNLGNDIYIHGGCLTAGCIPITDDLMKELYVYCVESKNNGNNINMVIFPAKLTNEKYTQLTRLYSDRDMLDLWKELKEEYDYFETTGKRSKIKFLQNGRHKIN